jgi:hypothetical protein
MVVSVPGTSTGVRGSNATRYSYRVLGTADGAWRRRAVQGGSFASGIMTGSLTRLWPDVNMNCTTAMQVLVHFLYGMILGVRNHRPRSMLGVLGVSYLYLYLYLYDLLCA